MNLVEAMDEEVTYDFKVFPIKSHIESNKLSIKYKRVFGNRELSRLYQELRVEDESKKSVIKHIKGSSLPEYMFRRLNLFNSFTNNGREYTKTDVSDTWFFWVNKNKTLSNINFEKYIPQNSLCCIIPLDDLALKFTDPPLEKVKIEITQCYIFFDIIPKLTMSDEEKNFILITWNYS